MDIYIYIETVIKIDVLLTNVSPVRAIQPFTRTVFNRITKGQFDFIPRLFLWAVSLLEMTQKHLVMVVQPFLVVIKERYDTYKPDLINIFSIFTQVNIRNPTL